MTDAYIMEAIQPQLDAQQIIADFFGRVRSGRSAMDAQQFAEGVIARLAGHEPKILLGYPHHFKDHQESESREGRYHVLYVVPARALGTSTPWIPTDDEATFDADSHGIHDGHLTLYKGDGPLNAIAVFPAGEWHKVEIDGEPDVLPEDH